MPHHLPESTWLKKRLRYVDRLCLGRDAAQGGERSAEATRSIASTLMNDPELPTSIAWPMSNDGSDTLAPLITAIAHGDESALAQLYDVAIGKLYGVALRITRRPELAEEVIGDVFHQVWREAARYDPIRGHAIAWLMTICRSRALDLLRTRDPAVLHEAPDNLRDGSSDLVPDAFDILSALDERTAVHRAMRSLSSTTRELITLAFYRGMSHAEIAEETHLPLGTVKSRLRNGLSALRKVLEGASS